MIARKVRLLVVDSIAALVRSEFGRDRLKERQELLSKQASTLKYLAELFRIPVLVTNQVTASGNIGRTETTYDFVKPGENQHSNSVDLTEQTVVAALGTKWSHCVNIRLILESFAGQRFLKIGKSPMAPCLAFPYVVTVAGIELVSDQRHDAEFGGNMTIRNEGSTMLDGLLDYG